MVPFPGANCAGGPVLFDRLGRRKSRLPAALRRHSPPVWFKSPLLFSITQKQPVQLDELFLNVMREQFRYMLKTGKIESWGGFELFQPHFLLSIAHGYEQSGHS